MGVPRSGTGNKSWNSARVAFAVVPSAAADRRTLAAAWEDLYELLRGDRSPRKQGPAGRSAGVPADQRAGRVAPPARSRMSSPPSATGSAPCCPSSLSPSPSWRNSRRSWHQCLRGERTWDAVTAESAQQARAMFPVALPRVSPGRHLARVAGWSGKGAGGTAVTDRRRPRPGRTSRTRNIAFGPGHHFCPGAALTRVWLAIALAEFFGTFPLARLADGDLHWQAGYVVHTAAGDAGAALTPGPRRGHQPSARQRP